MATTLTERKLFVGGEWVETGDWIDVRSPYSGNVVGRAAKGGADETRRAVDAAEQAMREPLPPTSAPRSWSKWRRNWAVGTTRSRA